MDEILHKSKDVQIKRLIAMRNQHQYMIFIVK